ncbi:MAG: glycogen debranching protein [Phycisphaerales bacterium]|nr:glycogen debranching protein [Phycisphaerales bacterium]
MTLGAGTTPVLAITPHAGDCAVSPGLDLEWLVTNGIGGYASGTVAGALRRRYHGWLVAATTPPAERTLFLAKLEETLSVDRGIVSLGTGGAQPDRAFKSVRLGVDEWASGATDPDAGALLESFWLEGAIPCWRFRCGDTVLERRICMVHGENTTCVQYRVPESGLPVTLTLDALVNRRNHHHLRSEVTAAASAGGDWCTAPSSGGDGVLVSWTASPTLPAHQLRLCCTNAHAQARGEWWRDWLLNSERARGYDYVDNHLHAATFRVTLSPGQSCQFVASCDERSEDRPRDLLAQEFSRQEKLVAGHSRTTSQLVLAADQFIVRRGESGTSVIAGYPWFADWGRDSLISLGGLFLATGRTSEATALLSTWADFVEDGLLPNRFPDDPSQSHQFGAQSSATAGEVARSLERNSVDAPLLFIAAVHRMWRHTSDDSLLARLFPACESIGAAYLRGTRHGIGVDPADGLLHAGERGLQVTWMDARIGDRVVTPRAGKPVEVNALWYHALRCLQRMSERLSRSSASGGGSSNGAPTPTSVWRAAAQHTGRHMSRFWNQECDCCFDVIDGAFGHDYSIRPNQLLLVSLPDCALPADMQRSIVDTCIELLWTPVGVRTLAPSDPAYEARCVGTQEERDNAYHQGTVWPWLLGPMARAHLRVHGDPRAARALLTPCLEQLTNFGVGTLGEIFDADPPHAPRGCIAQAWSVAEALDILSAGFDSAMFEDLEGKPI